MHLPWPYYKWKVTHMQLFHSSILKSYLQIVFLTYAIRNITMPAYSTGLLVCFYIFFCTITVFLRVWKQDRQTNNYRQETRHN